MQILDAATENKRLPLLRLAFRPFFLLGTLFVVIALGRWLGLLSGDLNWSASVPHISHILWHGHEMLFGLVMASGGGFLLTAVQNWTGQPGLRGAPLAVLVLLWLAGRISWWLGLPSVALLLPDLLFIVGAMLALGRSVVAVRQWRNLVFVPVLSAFTLVHLLMVLSPTLARGASLAGVWLTVLLIAIVGGRVIPFFTCRRWNFDKVQESTLELALANLPRVVIALLALFDALGHPASRVLLAVAALIQLRRCWRWWDKRNWGESLLWSLHLAYLCLPLALLIMAAGDASQAMLAFHLLAIGTIGGVILAMIARVSLGHTGRSLQAPKLMPLAFVLILAAALARALLPLLWPQLTLTGWWLGGGLMISAFALFVGHYASMLMRARADGRPG